MTTQLELVLSALDAHRPFVAAHSRRVATWAVRLAAQFGMSADDTEAIRLGALLHDVGKLAIPLEILLKAGPLSAGEWEELRQHPEIGVDLADRAGAPDAVCEIILSHHERLDGLGYPERLAGATMPLGVRIVVVADVFDALTSRREYRQPMNPEAARVALARYAGTRYCPWVVNALMGLPGAMLTPSEECWAAPQPDTAVPPLIAAAAAEWIVPRIAHCA